jgi:hypothetical protein
MPLLTTGLDGGLLDEDGGVGVGDGDGPGLLGGGDTGGGGGGGVALLPIAYEAPWVVPSKFWPFLSYTPEDAVRFNGAVPELLITLKTTVTNVALPWKPVVSPEVIPRTISSEPDELVVREAVGNVELFVTETYCKRLAGYEITDSAENMCCDGLFSLTVTETLEPLVKLPLEGLNVKEASLVTPVDGGGGGGVEAEATV